MRLPPTLLLSLLLSPGALPTAAQSQQSAASNHPQHDPGAVSALTQMVRVTGWARQASIRDGVLSGTLTRHFSDGDQTASFTMKVRGNDQYDYVEDGTVRFMANGAAGAVVDREGKVRRIPPQSALSGRALILPLSATLLDWSADDVEVVLVGDSSVNSEACVGVQLERKHPDSKNDPLAATRRSAAPLTLWISKSRGLVIRADYNLVAADNHGVTLRQTVTFSDYRNVRGLPMPFRQDISIGAQPIYTYQFSDVQFNQGLNDLDFNVTQVLGGAQ